MVGRGLKIVYDADGEDRGQIFGGPVGLGRGRHGGNQGAGRFVAAQFATGGDQVGGDGGQQAQGRRPVHQQGLGRAADRDAAHLGVQNDGAGGLQIGGLVQIGVVQAFQMAEHGRSRLGLDASDQALAATRDDDVDGAAQPGQHQADGLTVGSVDQLHRIGGQSGLGQGFGDQGGDG